MKKNYTVALLLILIAAYLVVNRLGLFPDIPVFMILFTILFAYTAIKGFMHLNFFEGFFSVAILGCIHDELLHIERLTPWTLLLVALLLSVAFEMLFKGVRSKKNHVYISGQTDNGTSYVSDDAEFVMDEDTEDGFSFHTNGGTNEPVVHVENTFGSTSKYVNSTNLQSAAVKNSFGECTVYFNNAVLAPNAALKVDCSFGSTSIYLPKMWRVTIHENSSLGNITYHGSGNNDMSAPCLDIKLDASFGVIDVYFE